MVSQQSQHVIIRLSYGLKPEIFVPHDNHQTFQPFSVLKICLESYESEFLALPILSQM